MESAHVFTSNTSNSRKSLFGNREEALTLKIEGDQISGKGYVCNEEGKNGYVDDFSFTIKEIDDISVEEYLKVDALSFNAQIKSLYGAKKVKVFLPNIKNVETAMGILRKLKRNNEKAATTSTPVAAPVKTVEPEKKEAVQVKNEDKGPASTPKTDNVASSPKKESSDNKSEMTKEEFKKRMDKLAVLKDCGLLEEKEYISKKLELLSELYDLKDFNEKLQKIIALKECGLLSDKEFDANRMDLIKECCDLNESNIDEYRRNIQKLAFMQIGDVISEEEHEKSKLLLIQDVSFGLEDSKEIFTRKLKRLPVLKECQVITEDGYNQKVEDLLTMLEVSRSDDREDLVNKLKKWPVLVQENYMDATELKTKQSSLVSEFLDVAWETPGELKAVVNKMSDLKEGECLTEEEFQKRREKILKDVDAVDDYTIRITMYKLLPQVGFITTEEFAALKQKCIDNIFENNGSVEDFKVRANNLVELQRVGILTSEELTEYKLKLMSEL